MHRALARSNAAARAAALVGRTLSAPVRVICPARHDACTQAYLPAGLDQPGAIMTGIVNEGPQG
jgi:hypothetical protein